MTLTYNIYIYAIYIIYIRNSIYVIENINAIILEAIILVYKKVNLFFYIFLVYNQYDSVRKIFALVFYNFLS